VCFARFWTHTHWGNLSWKPHRFDNKSNADWSLNWHHRWPWYRHSIHSLLSSNLSISGNLTTRTPCRNIRSYEAGQFYCTGYGWPWCWRIAIGWKFIIFVWIDRRLRSWLSSWTTLWKSWRWVGASLRSTRFGWPWRGPSLGSARGLVRRKRSSWGKGLF